MNYTFKLVREVLNDDAPTMVASPAIAARYLRDNCFDPAMDWRENCWMLLLNKHNEIIGQFHISEGSPEATGLYPSVVALVAVKSLAQRVILAHNHPSGPCRPSPKDIERTQDVKKALDCLGIDLVDHIVFDRDCKAFYSFSEEREQRLRVKSSPIDIFSEDDIKMLTTQ